MPLFPLPFSTFFPVNYPMASSSSNNNPNPPFPPTFHPFPNGFDPNSIPNTTFVQADPSTFRAVVQRLTGASPAKISGKPNDAEMGARRRPAFKLHERRPTARKLEIKLNGGGAGAGAAATTILHSPSSSPIPRNHRIFLGENMVMASPVSPLDQYLAAVRGSPKTPRSPMEEEERAIADKGFYFHPSPLSTPRGSDPPALLPLFPLHSPRDNNYSSSSYN